jgi:hypothetical protein
MTPRNAFGAPTVSAPDVEETTVNESTNHSSVAAVITVNDMYHELQGVREAVQMLAGKFDDTPRQLAEHSALLTTHSRLIAKLDPVPTDVADHEVRLRLLERTKWTAVGIALVASAAASSGIWALLIHH